MNAGKDVREKDEQYVKVATVVKHSGKLFHAASRIRTCARLRNCFRGNPLNRSGIAACAGSEFSGM